MTWEDVRMVNCAGCNRELLADHQSVDAAVQVLGEACPAPMQKRIDGRPYCERCVRFIEGQTARSAAKRMQSQLLGKEPQ